MPGRFLSGKSTGNSCKRIRNSGNRSYPEEDVDYSEGTDDPNRMEQVYETNAVDVDDVEVTRDDD